MPRDSLEVLRMKGAHAEFGNSRPATFRPAAEAAPFTLRTLGLGAGIATLAAKKEAANKEIAAMIARWLLREGPHVLASNNLPAEDAEGDDARKQWIEALLGAIEQADRNDYKTAQSEALAFAGWIKKLAKAFCPEGSNG